MMKQKNVANINRKNQRPTFIKNFENAGDFVQVAVRVPASLKSEFEAAQRTLRLHDLEMPLTDVVQDSMTAACTWVREIYGSDRTPPPVSETSGINKT